MNEYEYIYYKLRKDFGRHCGFEDTEAKMLGIGANTTLATSEEDIDLHSERVWKTLKTSKKNKKNNARN